MSMGCEWGKDKRAIAAKWLLRATWEGMEPYTGSVAATTAWPGLVAATCYSRSFEEVFWP